MNPYSQRPRFSERELESLASRVLVGYQARGGSLALPIRADDVIERYLDRQIVWERFSSLAGGTHWSAHQETMQSALAFSDPTQNVIWMNEDRLDYFLYDPDHGRHGPNTKGSIRFTQAHEICHCVLHIPERRQPYYRISLDNRVTIVGSPHVVRDIEREAESFAGYLTMPTRLLLRDARNVDLMDKGVIILAKLYGVNLTAMAIQLDKIGLPTALTTWVRELPAQKAARRRLAAERREEIKRLEEEESLLSELDASLVEGVPLADADSLACLENQQLMETEHPHLVVR